MANMQATTRLNEQGREQIVSYYDCNMSLDVPNGIERIEKNDLEPIVQTE
jgi:hypothetical protein